MAFCLHLKNFPFSERNLNNDMSEFITHWHNSLCNIKYVKNNVQSNLCITTTLVNLKSWSLWTGGRYSEVVVVNSGLTVFDLKFCINMWQNKWLELSSKDKDQNDVALFKSPPHSRTCARWCLRGCQPPEHRDPHQRVRHTKPLGLNPGAESLHRVSTYFEHSQRVWLRRLGLRCDPLCCCIGMRPRARRPLLSFRDDSVVWRNHLSSSLSV